MKQRDLCIAFSNGFCEVCGQQLTNNAQMAHRIGNTKMNRKKYGDFIIDHRLNVGMTCNLACNAKLDISFNPRKCIEICKKIYEYEFLKFGE